MPRLVNDRYRLVDGSEKVGGFSVVYEAWDVNPNPPQRVALKLLRAGAHNDETRNKSIAVEFESLSRLEHPNVVGLLDADVDAASGERFLALEWVESTLEAHIAERGVEPDTFISGVGLGIARAVAYAHENNVAHRDLKPANILVTADGTAKVADFGISRILDWLQDPNQANKTLHRFASEPYAPPEADAGPIGRDVWGLGATLLAGLVGRRLDSYDDLREARDDLDAVPDLTKIILSCLDQNPTKRPRDCRVVLAQLEAFWRTRSSKIGERLPLFIGATRRAAQDVRLTDTDEAAREIARDLRDEPVIVLARSKVDDTLQYIIYGNTRAYRVAPDQSQQPIPRLVVITAFAPHPNELDRVRDQGFELTGYEFKVGIPPNRSLTQQTLNQLLEDVARHDMERSSRVRETEQGRVLDQWRRQIQARTKIETDREKPVLFTSASVKGRRVTFWVKGETSGVQFGEIRRVLSSDGRHGRLRGHVDDFDAETVTLYITDEVEEVPISGKLIVDTKPSKVKIQREQGAVDLLNFTPAKAARADLAALLFEPERNAAPVPVEPTEWVTTNLDQSKREAVRSALGATDFFVVQGPPGTGKTTFIAELVAQELRLRPASKILITSQTNVALDNALDRVGRSLDDQRIVRLADPKHGKVGAEAQRFVLDGQLRRWRAMAQAKSNAFLEAWVQGRGVDIGVVHESRFLREMAGLISGQDSVELMLGDLADESSQRLDTDDPLGDDEYNERVQDIVDRAEVADEARRSFEQSNKGLVSKHQALIDRNDADALEAASDTLLGGSTTARELRELVSLQSEWLQRLGRGEGFVAALTSESSVIGATCIGLAAVQEITDVAFDLCIIDECSKATATETLVPMVRSKRWVLVGDDRQLPPMVEDALRDPKIVDDFQIDRDELTLTLFSRLAHGLPPESRSMLSEQHRMVRPIGELISECFYGSGLKSVGPENSPSIAGVFPKAVTWHDTSTLTDRFENPQRSGDTSAINTREAQVVADLLRRLDRQLANADTTPTVLVLAPYSAQVRQLQRSVYQLGELSSISVEVATVDAVQGREAEYVVFSVTRSNPQHKVGFLRLDARANVALSRARSGLAIVGDLAFCRSTDSPFKDVAHYIGTHSDTCAVVGVRS